MRNKSLLLQLLAFFLSFVPILKVKGQVLPNNCPPVIYSGTFSSGTYTNAACNAELNPLSISDAANYDIKARNYIHMPAGNYTLVSSLSTGSFHAHIEPAPFVVVSYHPLGFNNIPQYDKFELGIKLPQNLTDSIDNFFGDTNFVAQSIAQQTAYPCKNGYGNEFNDNSINPYDPDQISIEATFSFPNKPDQTIYGFYYREYIDYTLTNPNPTYQSANWEEDTTLQYHWRVRFTPKNVGTYRVKWRVFVNNQLVLQDEIGQDFTTISSSNPGFLKLGSSGKFLVTQPNDPGPETSIIPIGVCYAYVPPARANVFNGDPEDNVPNGDCFQWGCPINNSFFPSRYYRHRQKVMKEKLADFGGNYIRVYNSVDCYLAEWEKAHVYDASPVKPLAKGIQPGGNLFFYKGVNRQAVMWEFDRFLDVAQTNSVYIQYVLEDGPSNGYQNANGDFPWITNPYYIDVISQPKDPNSINQFFTDPASIVAYKKRLRYMFSRFGYSTSLAVVEIVNEIHQFRDRIADGSTLDGVFKAWLDTMTNYIRNPIASGGLGHTDHLLTVSFEPKQGSDPKWEVNQIGLNSPNLDFLSRHPYDYRKRKNQTAYNALRFFSEPLPNGIGYVKLCQAGELGLGADWRCNSQMAMRLEFLTPTFHSMLWSTAFIGGLTTGLCNWGNGLDIDLFNNPNQHICTDGLRQHFKPLKNFISSIDFNAGNYVPRYNDAFTNVESFYLVNNNGIFASKALGYLRNKTFYWYNFTEPNNNVHYDQDVVDEYNDMLDSGCVFPGLDPLEPVAGGFYGSTIITGLIPNTFYDVDWFDTYDEINPFLQTNIIQSNGNGLATITTPYVFGGCPGHEYAFKIHLPGQQRSSNLPGDNNLTELAIDSISSFANWSNQTLKNTSTRKVPLTEKFNIFPNPGKGAYTITFTHEEDCMIDIYNAYGANVETFGYKGTSQVVNIEHLSNGVYTFILRSKNGNYVKKVIKQ